MTTTTASDVISSDRVDGTTVHNVGGEKLGTIDDLMIDKVSGHVRYAVMEFGGFLGMGTDRYPIPWNMLKYDPSRDGYVVPLGKAQIEVHRATPTIVVPSTTRTIAPAWIATMGSKAVL
jgi:sporulation protein YlmC with PRC-barrel domain